MSLIGFSPAIFQLPLKRNRNQCSTVWVYASSFCISSVLFSPSHCGFQLQDQGYSGNIEWSYFCVPDSLHSISSCSTCSAKWIKRTAPHLFLLCDLLFICFGDSLLQPSPVLGPVPWCQSEEGTDAVWSSLSWRPPFLLLVCFLSWLWKNSE